MQPDWSPWGRIYQSQSFRTPRAFLVCFCEVPSAVTRRHWLSRPSGSAPRPHGEASVVTVTLHNTAPKGTADVGTDGPLHDQRATVHCGANGAANQDAVVPAIHCWKSLVMKSPKHTTDITDTISHSRAETERDSVRVSTRVALTVWHNKKGSLILSPKYSMHCDGSNRLFASFILKPGHLLLRMRAYEIVVCAWKNPDAAVS